jgi:hypothetical protein
LAEIASLKRVSLDGRPMEGEISSRSPKLPVHVLRRLSGFSKYTEVLGNTV